MQNYKHKRVTISIPQAEYSNYSVGLQVLKHTHISATNFVREEIAYIGEKYLNCEKIILGRVGNVWIIRGYYRDRKTEKPFVPYYVIFDGTVTASRQSCGKSYKDAVRAFNEREYSQPLSKMSAEQIFRDAKGKRPSRKHAPKMRLATRIANSVRMEKF